MSTESTQGVPQKVITSRRKVEECEPLASGPLSYLASQVMALVEAYDDATKAGLCLSN